MPGSRQPPNPVRALPLQQERQLANVLRDSIQARIQRRVAGQVAAIQLVVLLPRARVGFMNDAPATTPVSHGLRRLLARDVEPEIRISVLGSQIAPLVFPLGLARARRNLHRLLSHHRLRLGLRRQMPRLVHAGRKIAVAIRTSPTLSRTSRCMPFARY